MLSSFKSSSFNNQEEDLYPSISPSSTPPRISRKPNKEIKNKEIKNKAIKNNEIKKEIKNKQIKNPYATRGLDKFSALLADLEEKKQKIYSQKDSKNISSVRFAYSSSNDVVPIVIKSKDSKQEEKKAHDEEIKQEKKTRPRLITFEEIDKPRLEAEKISSSWKIILENLKHPSYYVPVVIILILVLLTFVGRFVAILFTCLVWYTFPVVTGPNVQPRRRRSTTKKRDSSRRPNDNKIANDGSSKEEMEMKRLSDGIARKIDSPRDRVHRKSW